MFDTNHTFVVCAYKESAYLERCVRSLLRQTIQTNIIMVTSTPNEHIRAVARRHNILLLVREGESDICRDWNFACRAAKTDWVTVAHQDDCYHKRYVETLIRKRRENERASLFITDYLPIKHGKVSVDANCILRKLLKWPLRIEFLGRLKGVRRMTLSFGNSICCPAVTYNLKMTGYPVFTSKLKYNLDWDTFLKYAGMDAPFLYVPEPLTYYRIHKASTSAKFIANDGREREDRIMFGRFWPEWFVKILMIFYKKAYKTYED